MIIDKRDGMTIISPGGSSSEIVSRRRKKQLPKDFSQVGQIRDLSNHKNYAQATSWEDLSVVEVKKNEETELKQLPGIKGPDSRGSKNATYL